MPKVSFVVPVYNVKQYLQKCVDSIVRQSMDAEIILVDDGSTDGSGEFAEQLARAYEGIRVIHRKNGGLSAARNTGLKAAKGEYVLFVDSDDWLIPDTVAPISDKEKDYMRIAFITPSLRHGGYEKVVIAYANELAERGHEIDILCGHIQGELINAVNKNVTLIDFNSRARSFIFPLISYLKSNKVDILYSAFRDYNCISVIAKAISRSNVMIYATQHGFEKDNRWISWLKGRIIANADRIITVANAIADYEANELGIPRDRFIVFNNPVLDQRYSLRIADHPWLHDRSIPVIGVSGRLAEGKGTKYCLEILKEISKKKRTRMLILGDGPLRGDLEALAEEIGIADCVDFLGYVKNPIDYMAGCQVFLHTALVEGFGNVVVEAMFAGIPVCVTNCSGPMQIIRNGEFGMDLGCPTDEGFIEEAARKVLMVINREVKYPRIKDRALDFEVKKATDQFLKAKEG